MIDRFGEKLDDEPDDGDTTVSALSIADCSRCNSRGDFGTTVCDHVPDRIEINRRGMAQVRAVLAAVKRKSADG